MSEERWYCKDLGDGLMAYLPLGEIEAQFQPRFEAAGQPDDMAIFKQHELGSGLHCGVVAFFSPATEEVARACGATPCARPARDEVALVFGNNRCWPALFADQQT